MQHLEDVFRATHLIEPIVYQCGSAGEKVISHVGLDVGAAGGMEGTGFGN